MLDAILDAIQQPGCPNLYWALAILPEDRLFEMHRALEFESGLITRLMPDVSTLGDDPIGPERSRRLIRELAQQAAATLAANGDRAANDFNAKLASGLYVVTMADEARELLAQTTPWADRAWRLSAPEAVLRASYLKIARYRDRWLKWSLLPPEAWDAYEAERNASLGGDGDPSDMLFNLLTLLTPAVDAARRAALRTHQTRNLLISIEAIRMHAVDSGELPESIENLRPAPAWNDPLRDAPFGYRRTGPGTATLSRSPRWPGDEQTTFKIELLSNAGNE
jgi:hypothetical protein